MKLKKQIPVLLKPVLFRDDNTYHRLLKKQIFKYYRKNGFPFVNLSIPELMNDYKNLLNANANCAPAGIINFINDVDTYILTSNTAGINFCLHFMKHQYDIKIKGSTGSPVDAFNDDKKLNITIDIFFKFNKKPFTTNSLFNHVGFRQMLNFVRGTQFAANFRPVAAKYIYNRYGKERQIIYDYCFGFGGRLLGFSAHKYFERSKYIGVDPSTPSFNALTDIIKFLNIGNNIEIYKTRAEIFHPKNLIRKIDIAFSSPPYFTKEIYSNDKEQSCHMYKEYNVWVDKFLFKTIKNCYDLLKYNGHFIININNIKLGNKVYPCYEDTKQICKDIFGKPKEVLIYRIGRVFGSGKKNSIFGSGKKNIRYEEPIIVFKKKRKHILS